LSAGVREFYLTGGEPFLHPDIEVIVEDTLAVAPVTVLTNGTLFTERRVRWLAALTRSARHSLELRVSLDATQEAAHDAFRGAGAWARTIAGLRALEAEGLAPIVTLTRSAGRGRGHARRLGRCRTSRRGLVGHAAEAAAHVRARARAHAAGRGSCTPLASRACPRRRSTRAAPVRDDRAR
jgi:hypothetical protein